MRKRHHWAVKGSGPSIPFVLICVFGGPLTEITAQESLASGSRVRVTAPECALSGQAATFRVLRADTLVLDTAECPLASVTRLDVSIGRKSHILLGAGIGLATGALFGAVVYCREGCVIREEPEDTGDDFTPAFAFLFGALGGAAGGIAGHFIKTDRWTEVPLERLSVSLTPKRDGRFALGFSVRF